MQESQVPQESIYISKIKCCKSFLSFIVQVKLEKMCMYA